MGAQDDKSGGAGENYAPKTSFIRQWNGWYQIGVGEWMEREGTASS